MPWITLNRQFHRTLPRHNVRRLSGYGRTIGPSARVCIHQSLMVTQALFFHFRCGLYLLIMMPNTADAWQALAQDPRFVRLQRRKTVFLSALLLFSLLCYLVLPVCAGYFPEVLNRPLYGVLNLGMALVLLEFAIAWLVAYLYTRRALREFDVLTRELIGHVQRGGTHG